VYSSENSPAEASPSECQAPPAWMPYQMHEMMWTRPSNTDMIRMMYATSITPSERMCSKMNSVIFWDFTSRTRRTRRMARSMPRRRSTVVSWLPPPPVFIANTASAQSMLTMRRSSIKRVRAYLLPTLLGLISTRPCAFT